MPPTVIASRRRSASSDDQSSDEECQSQLPDAESLDGDDCCSSSCDSKFSDGSSNNQSTSSTPQHLAKSSEDQGTEEWPRKLPSVSSLHDSDAQHGPFQFFKFKRKNKLILYLFLRKLKTHLIMCFKFVLSLFIVLATVQFSFPHSAHHPSSHQFFPKHTLVTDYYDGELQVLAERLQHTDLGLVMYYAPWDRESQLARAQFAHAARILHDQVFFSAINCWQPESFCRMNHKVTSFPALVLHVNTGAIKGGALRESRAFPYSGPVVSEHLVRFLTAALRPYQHVPDRKHLASLQLTHSAVMLTYIHGVHEVDYTDPEEPSALHADQQFAFWYRAALHWLDYDKRAEVTWAVITSPGLAAQLGLINSTTDHHTCRPTTGLPPIRMLVADVNYEFNRTLTNWREPKPLLEWVMAQLADTAGWHEVPGGKSSALNSFLHRGPALLVFAPDHPQHSYNIAFDTVRGLWLQYSTCAPQNVSVQDTRAGRMANFLLDSPRRHAASLAITQAECAHHAPNSFGYTEAEVADTAAAEECSLPLGSDATKLQPDLCREGHFTCHPLMPFFAKPGSGVGELVWSLVGDACQSLFGYSSPASVNPLLPCCDSHQQRTANTSSTASQRLTSSLYVKEGGRVEDERVQELLLWHREEVCRRLQYSDTEVVAATPSRASLDSFAGRACSSNRTLQFGVLDSKLHADLGSRWGLNWTHDHQWSGAVLVDLQREAHYVLREPVSSASLAAFLSNFSLGLLDRVELTEVPANGYSSDYSEDLIEAESVRESVLASLRQYAGSTKDNAATGSEMLQERDKCTDGVSVVQDEALKHVDSESRHPQNFGTTKQDIVEKDCEQDFPPTDAIKKSTTEQIMEGQCGRDALSSEEDGDVQVTILELSADTYFNVTHQPGQGVVVLHHSRSCTFCTAASHAYLTAASHLAELASQAQKSNWTGVVFARIDMSANTLSWQLNFPRLPTLIYYPPYRKSSSRVLDTSSSLTAGNILRFIAAQLSPSLRTRLALAGCSSACVDSVSARLPVLLSQVKNQLRLVLARLQRVTEALLQLQSENQSLVIGGASVIDDSPIQSFTTEASYRDSSLLGASSKNVEAPPSAVGTQVDSLNTVDLGIANLFESSRKGTPLSRLEILQLRRASITEELTLLRSRAQYLNILQKIVVQRTSPNGEHADESSYFFESFSPLL